MKKQNKVRITPSGISIEEINPELVKEGLEKMRKPKAAPKSAGAPALKGFLQSGILFIGDPVYMSGDLSQPGSEAIESPENPFLNWGKFTDSLGSEDASLPFPGAIDDSTSAGRGIAVQTNRLSGRFEIEKTFDENGKLSQLLVKFYE